MAANTRVLFGCALLPVSKRHVHGLVACYMSPDIAVCTTRTGSAAAEFCCDFVFALAGVKKICACQTVAQKVMEVTNSGPSEKSS